MRDAARRLPHAWRGRFPPLARPFAQPAAASPPSCSPRHRVCCPTHLVTEPVAALDRVVHVPAPVIDGAVGQRRVDAALQQRDRVGIGTGSGVGIGEPREIGRGSTSHIPAEMRARKRLCAGPCLKAAGLRARTPQVVPASGGVTPAHGGSRVSFSAATPQHHHRLSEQRPAATQPSTRVDKTSSCIDPASNRSPA